MSGGLFIQKTCSALIQMQYDAFQYLHGSDVRSVPGNQLKEDKTTQATVSIAKTSDLPSKLQRLL